MNSLLIEQNNIRTAPLYETGLVHMSDSYRAAFGAEISFRPPRLVLTIADAHHITCAAGIRTHAEGLFSQHYLDQPIHERLSLQTGCNVQPNDILEVGGLACSSPFAIYPNLRTVFQWGRSQQIGWGIFTATRQIRRLLSRAKIIPIVICKAEAARVPHATQWGSYYEQDPWVCAFRDPAQVAGHELTTARAV
ncbi:hypothetical protein LSUCC0387_01260 [Rhodobacterales bacterium LSUCC0387]|nr:hypothetical protein [Rhodobacterales bacterium LSUCC0387]